MFNHKTTYLLALIAFLVLPVSVYANEENVIPASLLQEIHIGMNMESALKILGAPNKDACSGVYCAEWVLTDGRTLYIHGGSYVDTIQLKVPNDSSK